MEKDPTTGVAGLLARIKIIQTKIKDFVRADEEVTRFQTNRNL